MPSLPQLKVFGGLFAWSILQIIKQKNQEKINSNQI